MGREQLEVNYNIFLANTFLQDKVANLRIRILLLLTVSFSQIVIYMEQTWANTLINGDKMLFILS